LIFLFFNFIVWGCQRNHYLKGFEDDSHLKYQSVNFIPTKIDTISWGYLIEGYSESYDTILIVSSIYNQNKNCKNLIQIGETYPMKLRFESYYGEIDGFMFEGFEYSTHFVVSYANKILRGMCITKH
jgi:hypothetical protein